MKNAEKLGKCFGNYRKNVLKTIFLSFICLSQFGCSTPNRMTVTELNHYKIDCNKKNEQYQFLEEQKYSEVDAIKNYFSLQSLLGIASHVRNDTLNDSVDAVNGRHEAIIRSKQIQMRQQCLLQQSK